MRSPKVFGKFIRRLALTRSSVVERPKPSTCCPKIVALGKFKKVFFGSKVMQYSSSRRNGWSKMVKMVWETLREARNVVNEYPYERSKLPCDLFHLPLNVWSRVDNTHWGNVVVSRPLFELIVSLYRSRKAIMTQWACLAAAVHLLPLSLGRVLISTALPLNLPWDDWLLRPKSLVSSQLTPISVSVCSLQCFSTSMQIKMGSLWNR